MIFKYCTLVVILIHWPLATVVEHVGPEHCALPGEHVKLYLCVRHRIHIVLVCVLWVSYHPVKSNKKSIWDNCKTQYTDI